MYLERIVPQINVVPRPPAGSIVPQLQSVFGRQPIECFAADGVVFWEGDIATHVFLVVDGMLRVVKNLSGGRRAVTSFAYPGDILGISVRTPYFTSAETVLPSRIRRLARAAFHEATADNPAQLREIVQRLCADMAAADSQLVLLARKTAHERVCSFLLQMAGRMACSPQVGSVIDIPINRLDIADFLGLTKETVCRTLARLSELGVVSSAGRHGYRINAADELARHAGNPNGDGWCSTAEISSDE